MRPFKLSINYYNNYYIEMNLGFYYHIPLYCKNAKLMLPGYFAVFIDALARQVNQLTLFLYEEPESAKNADTVLQEKNINWVNLGIKTPAWHRSFFFRGALKVVSANLNDIDILLIRCPSPLAPYFHKVLQYKTRLAYLVVGDYGEGANHWEINGIRNWLIKHYLRWNDIALKKAVDGHLIFVNSAQLYTLYKQKTSNIHLIRTTTLAASDFWIRYVTDLSNPIKLAYIGRFDLQKGLHELIEAVAYLLNKGIVTELHFTGWEDSNEKKVEKDIKFFAEKLGIASSLHWHGKKRVGKELNKMYRDADIYILPSYHEGFPRTIWEAMANSCPVIATRVGSIPDYLEHGKHAWLIEPRSVNAIVEAVQVLIKDVEVRTKLIRNGYDLALENTLEVQTEKLVNILKQR